jgi:hypothetical protein
VDDKQWGYIIIVLTVIKLILEILKLIVEEIAKIVEKLKGPQQPPKPRKQARK